MSAGHLRGWQFTASVAVDGPFRGGRLLTWNRQDRDSQRLATILGDGLVSATALAASVLEPNVFRSGWEFAAYLGLVPR